MAKRKHVAGVADAIRHRAREAAEYDRRESIYAEVTSVDPLVAEPHGTSLVLEDDDLVLTQTVRAYDRDHTIDVGDTLVIKLMPNGDWLVRDVVSDKDVT